MVLTVKSVNFDKYLQSYLTSEQSKTLNELVTAKNNLEILLKASGANDEGQNTIKSKLL